MRHKLILCAITMTIVIVPRVTAAAEPGPASDVCRIGADLGFIVCDDGSVRLTDGTVVGGRSGTGGPWPPPGWNLAPVIGVGSDGMPCMWMQYFAPGSAPDYPSGTFDPLIDYPFCTSDPGALAVEPAILARQTWEQEVPLPRPRPYAAPGWAIAGKLVYLETNGELRYVYTKSTPTGLLEIVATGRYYIDWGDGESTGPHTVEGRPWPHGQITHDYVWSGTYDIVVTERWTATWSLSGRSGVLRELRTTGTIDDFPVRQIQAVIR